MRIRIRLFTLMRIRILAENKGSQPLEKVPKLAHFPYILACHFDPDYHFDADPDSDFYFMRIRILI
jgi:hypothetical protein